VPVLAKTIRREPLSCIVMSSGGQESPLAHGLLSEIGLTVYSFFLNEAGRHWLLVLNLVN